jgi:hypothetical protein
MVIGNKAGGAARGFAGARGRHPAWPIARHVIARVGQIQWGGRHDQAWKRHENYGDCRSPWLAAGGKQPRANHHESLVQLCFDFYMIEAKPTNLGVRRLVRKADSTDDDGRC